MRVVNEMLRLALRIRTVYERRFEKCRAGTNAAWRYLSERAEQIQSCAGLIDQARSRGWNLAAASFQEQLVAKARAFHEAVRETQDQGEEESAMILVPSPGELFAELQHLHMEFETVRIDRRKHRIAVHTEAIVLKGNDLGSFSISLHWPRLAEGATGDCFDIIALQPRAASSNDSITHPHVRDRKLCAGDATVPIAKALEQGRLVDAFCLIRSVLQTYNPDSAYQSLDDWDGISCWQCGATTNEDDRYTCDACNNDLCSECTLGCRQCETIYCTSCQTRCAECREPCCKVCLQTSACSELRCCSDCLQVCVLCECSVATSELDEETELCVTCQKADASNEAVDPGCDSTPAQPMEVPS
jgi:hypothetical protein